MLIRNKDKKSVRTAALIKQIVAQARKIYKKSAVRKQGGSWIAKKKLPPKRQPDTY